MLKIDKMVDEITFILSVFESYIRCKAKLGLVDVNISAEGLVADLLNALNGWELFNLNIKRSNYPCIDLMDEVNKIGVQVTAETGIKKIKDTFSCVERNGFNNKINRLILFMLLPKQKSYSVSSPKGMNFNKNDDIIDFSDVVVIAKKSIKSLEMVGNVLIVVRNHISSKLPYFEGNEDRLIMAEIEGRYAGLSGSGVQLEILELIKKNKRDEAKAKLDCWAKKIYDNASDEIYSLAEIYSLVNPVEAELHYRRAIELNSGNIKYANIRGLNLMKIGKLNEAENIFKACLDSADLSLKDRVHVLGNLGVLYKNRSRWKEAVDCFKEALALNGGIDNKEKVNNLNNLASCYNNISNFLESKKLLDEAYDLIGILVSREQDIDEKNLLRLKKSNILTNISIRLRHEAKKNNEEFLLREAISNLNEAVEIAELLKEKTELARHYGNLSNIYIQIRDYYSGRVFLEKSLDIAVENKDYRSEVAGLLNLGSLMIREGFIDEAEKKLREGMRKENNLYPNLRAHIYANMAIVNKLKGKDEEVKRFFLEAKKLYVELDMLPSLKELKDNILP
ncbi:SMEK domain-containing protein [Alcaligenes sp. GCM10023179]|uniref:SMEK domain-containing protein n=1 Tax=Alcaligenes sp. GCM10023179 TaxID=3252633 RepID=UPI003605AB6A